MKQKLFTETDKSKRTIDIILNKLNIEFVSNDEDIVGHLVQKKDIKAFGINLIDFPEILALSLGHSIEPGTFSNAKLKILQNGNYFIAYHSNLIQYTSFSYFLIYDPIEKSIVHKTPLKDVSPKKRPPSDRIESVHVIKNKIAIVYSEGPAKDVCEKVLKIYNRNFINNWDSL